MPRQGEADPEADEDAADHRRDEVFLRDHEPGGERAVRGLRALVLDRQGTLDCLGIGIKVGIARCLIARTAEVCFVIWAQLLGLAGVRIVPQALFAAVTVSRFCYTHLRFSGAGLVVLADAEVRAAPPLFQLRDALAIL